MSYKTSLYNGVKSFLYDSTKDVQWATGVMYGAGAGATYGLGSGILSDNTSVFGGTVGGGTFGAAAGAGLAYSTNKSAAIRGALRDITNSAFGVNKAIRNMADEDQLAFEAAAKKAAADPRFSSLTSDQDKASFINSMVDHSTLNKTKFDNALATNSHVTLSNGLSVHGMDAAHASMNNAINSLRKEGKSDSDILSMFINEAGGADKIKAAGKEVPNSIDDMLKRLDRYK